MDIKHVLKEHAYRNIPLNFDEAYELGCYTLEGCNGNALAQIQSVATLCSLHTEATYLWDGDLSRGGNGHFPKSAAEQIAGVCAAVFEKDIGCSKAGFLEPNVPWAMDNCGMGGDLIVTANVSCIAAFIAAAAGIPMCKHGSPANADGGRHGSSDFVRLCGINEFAPKEQVETCIEKTHFGYTEALDTSYKVIHLQTHQIAKLPHMNDIIGPITNPVHPRILTRRVIGINHLIPPRVVMEAYRILNERGITFVTHALAVRGFAGSGKDMGFDELSICESGSVIAELKDGEIREYRLTAEDFGIKSVPRCLISPPQGMSKGEFSLAILEERMTGPPVEMTLANAAPLFYLAERADDLKECYQMAKETYESGEAHQRMLDVRKVLPRED